jgi:hypothetical protein
MGVRKISAALLLTAAAGLAQKSPAPKTELPDFSGVYATISAAEFRAGGPPARRGPPPKPTITAPLSDGSQGRAPDAPKLTPEYMAKWEVIRKSRMAHSAEYDYNAKCLPPGMPGMMNAVFGNRLEIMQTRDKITMFTEINDSMRRVYLDGRKPSQRVLEDPTYPGYSTGQWDGDTLVIDSVALRDNTFIEGFTPHSEAMTVHERMRFIAPDVVEDKITVADPKALTQPWEHTFLLRKAKAGADEMREAVCPEGLAEAK